MNDLIDPDIEGIYETQMTLEFRAIMELGCICSVEKNAYHELKTGYDTFNLNQLIYKTIASQPYLRDVSIVLSLSLKKKKKKKV